MMKNHNKRDQSAEEKPENTDTTQGQTQPVTDAGVSSSAPEKPSEEPMNQTDLAEKEKSQQDELESLRCSLADKEKEIETLSDKYLRLMAEYDNYRRRTQREKEDLYTDSIVQVVREWLPVLDNLDRAEWAVDQYESDEARKIAQGIAMIRKQVQEVLNKLGVEPIECCGKPFDPNTHDAVLHVEDESVGASTVVEELRKGYRKDKRVIRHSVVKVAN
jgi:molecular chaperone GrpE